MPEQDQNRIGFRYGSYEEYMALETHDPNTIYFTTNPNHIFKGDVLYTESSSVKYMSETEYNKLVRELACDPAVIYLVTSDETGRLKYIYVGFIMIGQAKEDGSIGFPYTFPIIF